MMAENEKSEMIIKTSSQVSTPTLAAAKLETERTEAGPAEEKAEDSEEGREAASPPPEHVKEVDDVGEGGHENGKPDPRLVAGVITSDANLTKNFMTLVTDEVNTRFRARVTMWTGISAAVAAFLIVALVFPVRSFIRSEAVSETQAAELRIRTELEATLKAVITADITSQLRSDTANIIESSVSVLRTQIQREGIYNQFAYSTLMIDFKPGGFSHEERYSAMSQLREISKSPELLSRPEFPALLEKLIDSFARANIESDIDRVVDLVGPQTEASGRIVETLVSHYGQIVVSDPADPEQWNEDKLQRFANYETAAKGRNLPELSLPWRLLIEFRKSGGQRTDYIGRLLTEAEFWTPDEKATFYRFLVQYSNLEFWMRRPTAQGVRIGEVSSGFLQAYSEELDALISEEEVLNALVNEAARISQNPEGEDLGQALMLRVQEILESMEASPSDQP